MKLLTLFVVLFSFARISTKATMLLLLLLVLVLLLLLLRLDRI